MIAAVLCGGKGTRLRSVIGDHQKCAVDVGGRPWIHRVLDFLENVKIEKAVLLTGYKAEEIGEAAAVWAVSKDRRMPLLCLHSEPAGPDAAVRLAFSRLVVPELLIVNGDTLILDFDLAGYLRETRGASTVVRGRPVLGGPEADAGLAVRTLFEDARDLPTRCAFLDIGTPKGLAEARRRFA